MVSMQLLIASFALWVAALVGTNAQVATNGTHVQRQLNGEKVFTCVVNGARTVPRQSLTIDMTSALNFMKTMQVARSHIKAVQGLKDESDRKKASADGVNCYATTGWDITITRPNGLRKTFGMLNNVYIVFNPNIDEQYKVTEPWYWSTEAFDEMLGWTDTATTPDLQTVAMLYTIGEALRFDWMRNRIAIVLKYEKQDKFVTFTVPHSALLTKWDAGFAMRLPVPESESDDWIKTKSWTGEWTGAKGPCLIPDESAISFLNTAASKGNCQPELVAEVKDLLLGGIRDRIAALRKEGGNDAKITALEAEVARITATTR